MYANFYHGEECRYSIKIETEKEGEHLADRAYTLCPSINDWTITEKPMSKNIYN